MRHQKRRGRGAASDSRPCSLATSALFVAAVFALPMDGQAEAARGREGAKHPPAHEPSLRTRADMAPLAGWRGTDGDLALRAEPALLPAAPRHRLAEAARTRNGSVQSLQGE